MADAGVMTPSPAPVNTSTSLSVKISASPSESIPWIAAVLPEDADRLKPSSSCDGSRVVNMRKSPVRETWNSCGLSLEPPCKWRCWWYMPAIGYRWMRNGLA